MQQNRLRELRRLLDQGRLTLLDTSILLSIWEREHQAEAKCRLFAELRACNPERHDTSFEEYRPS